MIKPVAALTLMLFAAAMRLVATAQQDDTNKIPTNLPGVTTVAAPAEGFDPREASDEDLRYYGFPPRPNQAQEPDAYATWARAMAASKHRVVPELQQTSITHGPAHARSVTDPGAEDEGPYKDYSWSGYVVTGSAKKYGKTSFETVFSHIAVPVANQANGACTGDWDYADSWVGIDGFKTNSVLQAGVEFDAYCNKSATAAYYSFWYGWYPNGAVRITNLPVSPGDDIWVEVWNDSATQGYAYLVNFTTDQAVEVSLTAPSGVSLTGNSVEWITERPGSTILTNYISNPYWGAYGNTFENKRVDPKSGKAIVMVDSNGNDISLPTLLGSSAFLMQTEGSATEQTAEALRRLE
jgi:hypothetical protein